MGITNNMEERPENTGRKQELRDNEGKFLPGVSGNPAGKPKGSRSFTTKVKEALEKIADGKDYTYEEAFIKAILKKAIIDQDATIIKLMWNYMDGMPLQKIEADVNNTVEEKLNKALYGDVGEKGKDIPSDIQDSEQGQDSSTVSAEPVAKPVQPQSNESGHNPQS